MLDLFEHIDIYFEIAMSVDLFGQIIYIGKVPFSNNNSSHYQFIYNRPHN